MIEDFDGRELVDPAGDHVGKVERSYVDDGGRVQFVEVKMGGVFAKHRLIPMDLVEHKDGALQVPFGKDVVRDSPNASTAGDTVEPHALEEVRAYYRNQRGESDPTGVDTAAVPLSQGGSDNTGDSAASHPAAGIGDSVRGAVNQVQDKLQGNTQNEGSEEENRDMGQIRDLGDVIEVPVVEEVLVKRPVVKEVLRIRKSSLTEQQIVQGDVRREDVEVVPEGEVPIRGDDETAAGKS